MSLLERLLGSSRSRACSEGVALLEQEKYAEAVDRLREASLGRSDHPSGSLASFHFRQALVARGRQLLRSGEPAAAGGLFGEAVGLWDQYPDLHCLHGVALGFAGDWEEGLQGARAALRRNPDYVEARLLEALALTRLDRPRDAAESLNALLESGRRVEHWLIDGLAGSGPYDAENLPADLQEHLASSVSGKSEKEAVASAVAQCRAGQWEAGLELFADLVRKRPRYPDYRTRHAAALFHLGRNDEALAEVEAALALNETYRTAIDLKGLILADLGRLGEAEAFLNGCDGVDSDDRPVTTHEELFGAYLRGVLSLLAGRPEDTERFLGGWDDLPRNFARAELLLAAADDQLGRTERCGQRLAELAAEWPAEPLYFYLTICHHIAGRRYDEAAGVLGRWPALPGDRPDLRPLYLDALLAVCRGRNPDRETWPGAGAPASESRLLDATGCPLLQDAAWTFMEARSLFLSGDDPGCWRLCEDLCRRGHATEKVVRLQTSAAMDGAYPAGWEPPLVHPDSCLPVRTALAIRSQTGGTPAAVGHLAVHPEDMTALWMLPDFWFVPVRGWIA